MSTVKKFSFYKYCTSDIRMMKVIGVDITEGSSVFYKLYIFITNILFSLLNNLVQIMNLFTINGEIRKFAECGYIISTCMMGTVKGFFLFKKRKELRQIISWLDDEEFIPKNPNQIEIAVRSLRFFTKTKIALVSICTAAVSFSMMSPWTHRMLPFPAWYPFDYIESPYYELVFFHQCFGDLAISYMNIYTDIMMGMFTTFIGIQCELLCDNLSSIEGEGDDIVVKFRECVSHHKKILKFAKVTEMVFTQIYFGQFAASLAALCMTLFLLTQIEPGTFQFFFLILYQLSMFGLLLVPCWFTSEMKRKSEMIPTVAFGSNWLNAPQSLKKELLYFIHRTQKPISFYAIGFLQISVETFMLIVRTSLSYYAVLKNVST